MDDQAAAFQELGEVVLEEVLVRAGLDQARAEPRDEIPIALHFAVGVDAERHHLVIRGERVGQAEFEVRLDLPEAPAAWRTPQTSSA